MKLSILSTLAGARRGGARALAVLPIVLALGAAGCGDTSTPEPAPSGGATPAAPSVPAAPQALRVGSPSASTLSLTWVDASSDETGFRIERAAAEAGPFATVGTAGAGAQQYTDSGLAAATRYYYRVRAQNGSGDSDASNVDTGATLPVPSAVPNAPAELAAADPTSASLRLVWNDRSSDETGFKVEIGSSPGGSFTAAGTVGADVATFTVNGLAPATTYYFRVRATNGSGDSDASNVAAGSTLALPLQAPNAPTGLAAVNITSSSLVLTWTDASDNETGFEVERSSSGGTGFTTIATLPANTPRYQVHGLSPQTAYSFRLRALNGAGASAYTAMVTVTTLATPTLPAAPANLAVGGATTNSLKLTWADRSDNETGFRIERSTSASTGFALIATTAADVHEFVDTQLAASTNYYYRVNAVSTVGVSAYTAVAGGTTAAPPPAVPAAPDTLTVEAPGDGSLALHWADRSDNETAFEIERRESAQYDFSQVASLAAGTTGWVNTGLVASNLYYFRVRARNDAGASAWSNIASATPGGTLQTITFYPAASNVAKYSGLDPQAQTTAYPNQGPVVGTVTSGGWTTMFRSAVQFNLAALGGKTIERATLNLKAFAVSPTVSAAFQVGAIGSPWSASTLTWDLMWFTSSFLYYYPSSYQTFATPRTPGQTVAVDLSGLVAQWASGAVPNHGLDIVSTDYAAPSNDYRGATTFEIPTLTVSYR